MIKIKYGWKVALFKDWSKEPRANDFETKKTNAQIAVFKRSGLAGSASTQWEFDLSPDEINMITRDISDCVVCRNGQVQTMLIAQRIAQSAGFNVGIGGGSISQTIAGAGDGYYYYYPTGKDSKVLGKLYNLMTKKSAYELYCELRG